MNQAEEWFQILDEVTQEVQAHFSNLSADELNLKPFPAAWSIGQVLDHLIIINESYFPVIESVRNGSYKAGFLGSRSFMNKFWYSTILRSVHPSSARKTKTQPMWEPTQSNVSADIVEQFTEHQGRMKKWITEQSDLISSEAVIHSPAAKFITYTLPQALDIITQHERRHLNQAKRVLEAIQLNN